MLGCDCDMCPRLSRWRSRPPSRPLLQASATRYCASYTRVQSILGRRACTVAGKARRCCCARRCAWRSRSGRSSRSWNGGLLCRRHLPLSEAGRPRVHPWLRSTTTISRSGRASSDLARSETAQLFASPRGRGIHPHLQLAGESTVRSRARSKVSRRPCSIAGTRAVLFSFRAFDGRLMKKMGPQQQQQQRQTTSIPT